MNTQVMNRQKINDFEEELFKMYGLVGSFLGCALMIDPKFCVDGGRASGTHQTTQRGRAASIPKRHLGLLWMVEPDHAKSEGHHE